MANWLLVSLRATAPIGAGLLSLALCAPVAVSQELPGEGTFSITYTSTAPTPSKPITIGKDREMNVISAIMAAVNDAGKGLLHNMAGRCLSMTLIDKAANSFEQHGYCSWIDRDGDQVFSQFDFAPQRLGTVATATGKWLGGTGKYAGVDGTFEIHHNFLRPETEGIRQGWGKAVGSYKKIAAAQ